MIRIIVGTKSALKIEAVKAAVDILGLEASVVGVETSSGVNPQPVSGVETRFGAENRTKRAHATDPGAYAIGIENGLVTKEDGTTVDVAYVMIITPTDGIAALFSEGVPVPRELVKASLESCQLVTAGDLEAKRSGCPGDDPHRVWSGGKTDRKTILTEAITRALLAATRIEGDLP